MNKSFSIDYLYEIHCYVQEVYVLMIKPFLIQLIRYILLVAKT